MTTRARSLVVGLALVLAACGDDPAPDPDPELAAGDSAPTTVDPDDEVRTDVFGEGSWVGARTVRDQPGLVVVMIGGPAYRAGDHCSVDYVASAEETAEEVRVSFTSRSPRQEQSWSCTLVGHNRRIEVPLREPLGQRRLVEAQFDREHAVFDGSQLRTPGWLPEGFELVAEQPGYPAPEAARTWQQTWAAPRPEPEDQHCVGGLPPVTLTQGPADALPPPAGDGELRWQDHQAAFVLRATPACDRDEPMDPAVLQRIADSIDGPSYSVDVDLECQAFELDGTWVLVEGDTAGWQPPGERHEGGTFTLESPDRGRFVGDAAGAKTAVFERLPDGEAPDCEPVPR